MAQIGMNLGVRIPWWSGIYIRAVVVLARLGIITGREEWIASILTWHFRAYSEDSRGRRHYLPAK